MIDAKTSLKAALGISVEGIKNFKAMDVNKDNAYDLKDVKIILQVALGIGSVEEVLKRPELTPGNVITMKPSPTAVVNSNEAYAREVLNLVNIERRKYNLSDLSWDASMKKAADVRAKELETVFQHSRPNGSSCFIIFDEMNISYMGCAENIAYGYATPAEVVNGWMNSPGHKANILTPEYTKLGVGYYVGNNKTPYWVQLFIY